MYMHMYIKTVLPRYICMYIPPTVHRILYYQDGLTAVVKVANVGVDPTFIIWPSAELARTVCSNCMSSTEGELHVNLGQLAQELGMKDKNITIWMSWELSRSWEARCRGGGLTWVYSREASTYDSTYITCDWADLNIPTPTVLTS